MPHLYADCKMNWNYLEHLHDECKVAYTISIIWALGELAFNPERHAYATRVPTVEGTLLRGILTRYYPWVPKLSRDYLPCVWRSPAVAGKLLSPIESEYGEKG